VQVTTRPGERRRGAPRSGELRRGSAALTWLAVSIAGPVALADTPPKVAIDSPPQREDTPEITYGPASGIEVGAGVVSPSVGTPFGHMLARLGLAMHTSPTFTLVGGAETGLGFAFGSGSPSYGYVVRLPFKFTLDGISSHLLDYRLNGYVNFHFGAELGYEYFLSAECSTGTCNYIPAGVQVGFGARIGISYSQGSRSSVGAFVRWDGDAAKGTCTGGAQCTNILQTFTWNLAWTLF
jgi:hypothetical protein